MVFLVGMATLAVATLLGIMLLTSLTAASWETKNAAWLLTSVIVLFASSGAMFYTKGWLDDGDIGEPEPEVVTAAKYLRQSEDGSIAGADQ